MLVWAVIAALLVLSLAGVLMVTWGEESAGADDVDGSEAAPRSHPVSILTPAYLRDVRIPGHGRGYDRASVDVLLQRAAEALEQATTNEPPHVDEQGDDPTEVAEVTSGEEVEDGGGDEAGSLDR